MPYIKTNDWDKLKDILERLKASGEMEHADFNDSIKVQRPDRTITINEREVTDFIKERTKGFRSTWITHIAENGLELMNKY